MSLFTSWHNMKVHIREQSHIMFVKGKISYGKALTLSVYPLILRFPLYILLSTKLWQFFFHVTLTIYKDFLQSSMKCCEFYICIDFI